MGRTNTETTVLGTYLSESASSVLVTMTNMAQNAFSAHLSHFGFNIFCALVVDLLHELEINVWKMLFMHLLRIVEAKTRDSLTNWTGGMLSQYMLPTLH